MGSVDCFGNIKQKLKTEECIFTIQVNDDSDASKRSIRAYKNGYAKFYSDVIAKKYKGTEYEEYPRNHRLCSFVDRRKTVKYMEEHKNDEDVSPNKLVNNGNDNNNDDDDEKVDNSIIDEDEIYFFEPPANCNVIPKNAVPLWYFDSSKTCIVPNIGYTEAMLADKINNVSKDKQSEEVIHSGFPAGGSLLILSFHVEAADNIRCYLYLNGCMTRFFAEDIVNLLPRYFEDSKENQEFIESDEAKTMIEEMKPRLRDMKFEAFYNEYKFNK